MKFKDSFQFIAIIIKTLSFYLESRRKVNYNNYFVYIFMYAKITLANELESLINLYFSMVGYEITSFVVCLQVFLLISINCGWKVNFPQFFASSIYFANSNINNP